LQVHSIGCSRLQNGCQLQHQAADRVVTSGCSFIGQQIWKTMFIELAILAICIKILKLSFEKRSRYIHISRWHTFDFWTFRTLIVTGWCRWHSRQRWRWFWCRLSALAVWMCTHSFAPPVCLRILRCASLAREAAVCLIFTNHSKVSFYCRLHLSSSRKLDSPLPLVSDFGVMFLEQVLCFF